MHPKKQINVIILFSKSYTSNSLKMKEEYYTLKLNRRKVKLKYAISLVDRLINSSDKSSIKKNLSQIWKLSGLSKNEFDVLFLKDKGVDIYQYCRDTNTDCKC